MVKILTSILFIILILLVLILAYQLYFEKWCRTLYGKAADYWDKHFIHKATTKIEEKQNLAKQKIKQETKEAGLNVWERIKSYIYR